MKSWREHVLIAKVAASVVLAVALLFVSSSLGARLPGVSFLSVFPTLRNLDYSPDHFRALAPLDEGFLAEALGDSQLDQLTGIPRVLTQPTPATTPTQPPPEDTRTKTDPTAKRFGDWKLVVFATADRSSAAPGDHITYTFEVRNVGTADYTGDPQFQLLAHVPYHTTGDASQGDCEGVDVSDPDNPCVFVPVPTPGSSDPALHQYNSASSHPIAPGHRLLFQEGVTVDQGTAPGTKLVNHVHLSVFGKKTLVTPDLIVTVT